MSGPDRHDRAVEAREALRKYTKTSAAGLVSAHGISARESMQNNQLPLIRREGEHYVRSMSSEPLKGAVEFKFFSDFFSIFNLPLAEIRCGNFTTESGKVPPELKACRNLEQLHQAVKTREETGAKRRSVENISWDYYLTEDQYAVVSARQERGRER